MSPASAGPLEVERYIGACLISSQHRTKTSGNRDVYYPRDRYVHHQDVYNGTNYPLTVDNRFRPRRCNAADGWAGGMPLISFANNYRRNRRPEPSEIIATKSEEATATPLARLAVHTQGLPLILSGRHTNRRNKTNTRNIAPQRPSDGSAKKDSSVRAVDALSIASDESSGSNNSETSLPRIIKPRKRRKKDRKPRTPEQETLCNAPANVLTLKPYVVPYCYTRERTFPPKYINNYSDTSRTVDKPVSERVIDAELSEAPQLHHRFEDVEGLETELESQQQVSSCQCRYCDPAGQIWDVDRHCYSPFLTSPKHLAERISTALENQCLISPAFTADKEVNPERTRQCLEISTEIVTSHNGHRDLEIRLFSTSARRLGSQPAIKAQSDTSDKCISSERVCSVSDDCGLMPEE